MPFNEADTKLHLITPALMRAGWMGNRITMEFPITAGQIVLQGDGHRQLPPKKADYLRRYTESLPIAILEAKDEEPTPGAGLQQAKTYAEIFGLYFPYSSNGHRIEEWDLATSTQRSLRMDEIPTREQLCQRLCDYKALEAPRAANPLLHPYLRDPSGKQKVRYYQEVAVNRVIEQMLKNESASSSTWQPAQGKPLLLFRLCGNCTSPVPLRTSVCSLSRIASCCAAKPMMRLTHSKKVRAIPAPKSRVARFRDIGRSILRSIRVFTLTIATDCDGICSVDQYVMRPKTEILQTEYPAYFRRSPLSLNQAIEKTHSLTLPRLHRGLLESIPIPVPSFDEQRRTVAYQDELQARVDTLKRLKENQRR